MSSEIYQGTDDKIYRTKFVYCIQHCRVHETGWCTVPVVDKIPLLSQTMEKAQEEWDLKTFWLLKVTKESLLKKRNYEVCTLCLKPAPDGPHEECQRRWEEAAPKCNHEFVNQPLRDGWFCLNCNAQKCTNY